MLRQKGKELWYLWLVPLIFVGCFLIWGTVDSVQTQEGSTCISCHTSVKDLVKITREIAAKSKRPCQKSAESKGEG